jgi:two-component sensor histidine kinase
MARPDAQRTRGARVRRDPRHTEQKRRAVGKAAVGKGPSGAMTGEVINTHIDASAYLENLCLSISRSKHVGMRIDLVLTASPLRLPSERCWRLGMIVYELVTNAARHAFGNGNGQIRVELSRAGKIIECRVVDNGSAPANVQQGHGLTIVDELVKGLDGRLDQRFGQSGSLSILILPYKGESQQAGHEEKTGAECCR